MCRNMRQVCEFNVTTLILPCIYNTHTRHTIHAPYTTHPYYRGPVISSASLTKITGMVHHAIHKEHAHVYTGGSPPPSASLPSHLQGGFYFEPTVLGVSTQSEIWREEVSSCMDMVGDGCVWVWI
ncbi:aldehyde dehydrogenase family protein [archaeon]|nr:MAG: aldehyde dehydrogenase family protein [archaeon]